MPVNKGEKKQILLVIDLELEERLRAFLLNPSKGYVPRGALSAFICEAIREKLDKGNSVSLEEFFEEMKNGG